MKQKNTMLRGLLLGGLLLGMSSAQAQLNCDATHSPCTTDGLSETDMLGAITLHADLGETTVFTSTVQQSVTNTVARSLTGTGAGDIELHVGGHLNRAMDLSAHTGSLLLRVQATDDQLGGVAGGLALTDSHFGSGDVRLVVETGALMTLHDGYPSRGDETPSAIRIDFGSGDRESVDKQIVNRGHIVMGDSRIPDVPGLSNNGTGAIYAREITLANLHRFDNEGELILGGPITSPSFLLSSWVIDSRNLPFTDTAARTALFMPGTDFVGGPGSIIRMDAVFRYGAAQVNCTDRVMRQPLRPGTPGGQPWNSPSLMAADCIDLAGGSTSGVTELVIYDEQPGALAANFGDNEILLVSVEGGESAAGHFVLSPQAQHYDARTRSLQQGFFQFPLIYDADNQQHRLISLPGSRALALPHVLQAVQAVTRNVGRDAVAGVGGVGEAPGVWVRLSSQRQNRDQQARFDRYNTRIGVDSSHDIDTTALTVGRSWRAGDWAVGGSISYVDGALDFDQNDMQADLRGANIGAHAQWQAGSLFVTNLVQLQWLEMDLVDPGFSPELRGSKVHGYVQLSPSTAYRNQIANAGTQALHLRSEFGWHLKLADTIQLEPMLGLSWVRADIDEVTIQSYDSAAADNRFFGNHADSLRATLGARAAFGQPGERFDLRYTGSLRYWHSLKDEAQVRIFNAGPDLVVRDDFDGGWAEVTAGLELSSPSGRITGQIEAQGMLGDYEGFGITAGLQLRW